MRLWEPAREVIQQLKHLMGQRNRIQKAKRMFENSSHEFKQAIGKAKYKMYDQSTPVVLKTLEQELAKINSQVF